MFELILTIWTWVTTHLPDTLKVVSGVKLFADTADSLRKLAPAKLEAKEAAQTYMAETLTIAQDQGKNLEERQMELDTRKDLTESMVKLTAIEAAYNIARYAIFVSFTAFVYHTLTRLLISRKQGTLKSPKELQ
jgi:hypothetical protein